MTLSFHFSKSIIYDTSTTQSKQNFVRIFHYHFTDYKQQSNDTTRELPALPSIFPQPLKVGGQVSGMKNLTVIVCFP
jgi:hypothetical protein